MRAVCDAEKCVDGGAEGVAAERGSTKGDGARGGRRRARWDGPPRWRLGEGGAVDAADEARWGTSAEKRWVWSVGGTDWSCWAAKVG